MTNEEKANEIRSKLTTALTVVNAIVTKANDEGFNVSYTSNLNNLTKEFEVKIDITRLERF